MIDPNGMIACPRCGHEFTVEENPLRIGYCVCCGDDEKEIQKADNPNELCVDCLPLEDTNYE